MAEDLEIVEAVLTGFVDCADLTLAELIRFMDDHPELSAKTRNVERRWQEYREQ